MAYEEFAIENLSDLNDGKVKAAFDRLMTNIVRDCLDRPGEKGARTITLKLKVKPVAGQEGMADSVNISPHIASSIPEYVGAPTNCNAKPSGKVLFNKNAREDADQKTIDELPGNGDE